MQRKKIQEAMAHVYFQKMTPTGYHEIEQEIEKLQAQRPAKIAQLKSCPSPRRLIRKHRI